MHIDHVQSLDSNDYVSCALRVTWSTTGETQIYDLAG